MKNLFWLSAVTLVLGFSGCSGNESKKLTTPKPIGELTPRETETPVGVQSSEVISLNGATATQITLPNNLKVTLLSSPTSKKSAASVAVKVGHQDNPIEHQGLAHYLEHMLFLGTDEFPIVGDYSKFLSENNGGSNAYTSGNHTNYYLDVRPEAFDEAVHRLSRFFVSPKFYVDNIEQEKEAVHNEFNYRFEAFKPNRVFAAFMAESSKDRLFSVGNSVSLGKTTAEDTKQFFEQEYHTEAMHAILAGPQSLQELEELAVKYFSDFKSNPSKELNVTPDFTEMDFSKLPAKVAFKPQGGEKSLDVFIPVQNPVKVNDKLSSMFGTLVGDESEDSLMYFLQQEGLVKAGAGSLSGGANATGASVTVQLTDKGVKNQDRIVNFISGYFKFLKEEGMPSYLNEELSKQDKAFNIGLSFYEVTGGLVEDLNREYISGEKPPKTLEALFISKENPAVTAEDYDKFLGSLDWSKVLITFTHPDNKDVPYEHKEFENIEIGGVKIQEIEGEKVVTDSLYKFAFAVEDVDTAKIEPKGNFSLKKENIYVPNGFDLYLDNQPAAYTKLSTDGGFVHYSALTDTNSPKSYLDVSLYSSKVDFTNKEDVISLYLMRELFKLQTAHHAYSMVLADFEMGFGINPTNGSLGLSFYGWSDTFVQAFSDWVKLTNLKPSVADFDKAKQLFSQNMKLDRQGSVDVLGVREMRAQVEHARPSFKDIFSTLERVDHAKFIDFTTRYASGMHYRGTVSGNIQTTFADAIEPALNAAWGAKWAAQDAWKSLYKLPSLFSKQEGAENYPLYETSLVGNSPSEAFYYGYLNFAETKDPKEKLLSRILGDWMGPDFYKELRTVRGLAYGLGAWGYEHTDNVGMGLYVQSSTALADDVEKQVLEYLVEWAKDVLPTKDNETLERTKSSYVLGHELPAEPAAIHGVYTGYVADGFETAEESKALLAPLSEITVEDVVSYGQKHLLEIPKAGSFVKVYRKSEETSN